MQNYILDNIKQLALTGKITEFQNLRCVLILEGRRVLRRTALVYFYPEWQLLSRAERHCSYCVIDRGKGPVEALKDSWSITKGQKGQLFLFGLTLLGLNLLGVIALVVGLLVTVPMTWLAVTHAYRVLRSQAQP